MKKILVFIGVVAVLCAGYYFSYSLGKKAAMEEEKPRTEIDVNVLRQRMERISELATVSYDYTDIASYSKTEKLWGYEVPFSTSKILLRYSGKIRAGVDLRQAVVTVSDSVVEVRLPEPRAMSHDVDPRSVKILDQREGLFSSIKIPDFQGFCMAHRDSMERVAQAQGLMEEARRGAVDAMEIVAAPLRDMGWRVEVTFGMGEKMIDAAGETGRQSGDGVSVGNY